MNTFADKFYQNFIEEHRYQLLLQGLGNTFLITIFAAILGILLGCFVAIVRSTSDQKKKPGASLGFFGLVLKVLDFICRIYLTVIRGTPTMIQLLIMYYVIFANTDNQLVVAILAFGINSGAYVAEIVRSGIMSIDKGQSEAGRSLGLNFAQTMWYIVIPQAFKNVLPALVNEFITLLKETSISGYIGLMDLTRGGDIIRSRTFDSFMALGMVAIVYLIIVMLLTKFESGLERRLRTSDR